MLSDTLRQLRERSELIIPPNERGDIPVIQKSLGQLEREMKSMSERMRPTQELHAKAHYFLASNGIDTEHMSMPINTSQTFVLTETKNQTNIKEFLDIEHEKILIGIIEDKRSENIDDFQQFYEDQFESFQNTVEAERQEEEQNMAYYKEFEKQNNTTGILRINEYASAIIQLNRARLNDEDFNVIDCFANIHNMTELKKAQESAHEAWKILNHLVYESGMSGRAQGRFIKAYAVGPYQSIDAVNTRRALIASSKSWLEQQSTALINDALNRNARKIQMGGIPSFDYRLRAFINLTFKTATGWTDDRLEIVQDLPIWVYVYLLMRSGHLDLAAKFVDTNREMFASDRKFISYFEQYNQAADNCVSRSTQEAILADYNKLVYGENTVDPYKIVIYKIIGRCELYKKSYYDIISTTEDYIWVQLCLVRDTVSEDAFSLESYRLEDLQKHISSYDSHYFDQSETNPWIYFKILLLTLQFEKAVDFLYKQQRLRLETVHFAIAFAYHGLLRMPPAEKTSTRIIAMPDQQNKDSITINFAHLLYQYIQIYIPDNSANALQYIYLLSLYSSARGYADESMVHLAKQYICRFVMDRNDFKTLLGSMDNERVAGLIENNMDLLNIKTIEQYREQILNPIAEQCMQAGRYADAVYVFSLSSEYNRMVDVLVKELSGALQHSQSDRSAEPTLSDASSEEIIQFAYRTMEEYEKYEPFSTSITSERKHTVHTLIQLLQFRVLYEQGQYEHALQVLDKANVVPLNLDHYKIQLLVDGFKRLDTSITKNIPEILLNAMDILYKTWQARTLDKSSPPHEADAIERGAKAVLTFAGLLPLYIPTDIMIRLNKADMMIMSARLR